MNNWSKTFLAWLGFLWCLLVMGFYYANNLSYYQVKIVDFGTHLLAWMGF